MRVVKRFLVILAAAGAVISLAGCENLDTGGLAIKREGTSLLVAVCEPIQPTDVNMEERGPASNNRWRTFWKSEQRTALLPAGITLSTSAEAPALSEGELKHDPSMAPGSEIGILLADNSQPYSLRMGFFIPKEGLSDQLWLQQGGTHTEKPCPDVEPVENVIRGSGGARDR